jgi:4-hydroxythreonine-4-phosphate dehydrogenase
VDNPRIAVLSLNPHSGDNGLLGSEEQKSSSLPSSNSFKVASAFGPYAATAFGLTTTEFRCDPGDVSRPGHAPFKVLAMDNGVNYTGA